MDRFTVVLARPAGPGNVGSISRLCANFGASSLVLVRPQFEFRRHLEEGLSSEMGWYSRHQGLELLREGTRVDASVAEAVAGCHRVVGFSRRRGRNRASGLEVGSIYGDTRRDGSVALLFGNEADGLTAEELASTTDIVEIPTAPLQGSMNLSHAVAVSLARVFEDCVGAGEWDEGLGGEATVRDSSALQSTATAEDLRALQMRLAVLLGEDSSERPERSGRGRAVPESELAAKILSRCRPTKDEIRFLHGLLRQRQP